MTSIEISLALLQASVEIQKRQPFPLPTQVVEWAKFFGEYVMMGDVSLLAARASTPDDTPSPVANTSQEGQRDGTV